MAFPSRRVTSRVQRTAPNPRGTRDRKRSWLTAAITGSYRPSISSIEIH